MTLIALALPPAALAAASFRTPGGAVYCGESEGEPPLTLICWRPADGLTAWMTRLGRSSFRIDRRNRNHRDAVDPPTLRYGRSWREAGFWRCTSWSRRLTCTNLAGHGWWIGPEHGARRF